jgi:hypothetical protein
MLAWLASEPALAAVTYEIKEAFEKFGADGLAREAKRKPRMANQTPPELEAQILEMTER